MPVHEHAEMPADVYERRALVVKLDLDAVAGLLLRL